MCSSDLDQVHPQLAAASNAAAAGEDPAVTVRAKTVLAQLLSGNVDRTQLDASMNAAMTPAILAGAKAQFAPLGAATTWVYLGKTTANGSTTYRYRVTFSSGTQLYAYMSVDAAGKISGYLLSPS